MYLQLNTVTYLTYAKILSNVSRIGPNPGTIFAVILRSVSFKKIFTYPGLFLFIFVLLTSQFNYKLKKYGCSAWDSNTGPQVDSIETVVYT